MLQWHSQLAEMVHEGRVRLRSRVVWKEVGRVGWMLERVEEGKGWQKAKGRGSEGDVDMVGMDSWRPLDVMGTRMDKERYDSIDYEDHGEVVRF